ncbi:BZ3500_MvSof-1268-A1-R1_Chr12-2g03796 [Microbotryum saponariae]|uniref:BZ3500_MvSof-1268-A1-R1_Chr12-2g03796 protein n=1 Tax=Microbotryum saponariae TaxID=289078 RepID=A0A2X0KN05_9BASI|nr:BZ3500_MvSof-1268-A1-R1_Chr12-2g03796 [Microbotryum saponariae]
MPTGHRDHATTQGGEEDAQVEVAVANEAAQMSTYSYLEASIASTAAAAVEPDWVKPLAAMPGVVFTGRRLQRDDLSDDNIEIYPFLLSDEDNIYEDAAVHDDLNADDDGDDGVLEWCPSPAPSLDGGKPFAYGGKPFLAPPLGRPSRSRRTRALDNMTPDEDKVAGIWCKHQFAQSIRRRSGLWLPIASFTVNDVIVATLRCVLGKLLYTADKFSAEVYGPVVFKIMDHCYDGSYTSITGVSSQCVWTSVAAWVGHKELRRLTEARLRPLLKRLRSDLPNLCS